MITEPFRILADPVRLRIVEVLQSGEHAVNDLVGRLDIHQSGVSRHLRILEQSGFVRVRPDGARRFYSLLPEPFLELDNWVSDTDSSGQDASTHSKKRSTRNPTSGVSRARRGGTDERTTQAIHDRAPLSR